MTIRMDEGAAELLDTLHRAGYAAYVVGGCVRDSLLGLTPHDWDLCTSALPQQVMELFGAQRCIPTGLQHGTVTVKQSGALYEITTFRTEGTYTDGRHPDEVHFVPDVREDLARRDFTINAMAYNEKEGLVDPFGGQADLQSGIVRAVGVPRQRFTEDALRILRLYRFAARFGFAIDPPTAQAAQELCAHLDCVSVERIEEELAKLLSAPAPAAYLNEKILSVVLPELSPEALAAAKPVVDACPAGAENLPIRLAALLPPAPLKNRLPQPETPDRLLPESETVILAVPTVGPDGMLRTPTVPECYPLAECLRRLPEGAMVLGGTLPPDCRKIVEERHLAYTDLLALPELQELNAIATAEGAVALAMREQNTTLFDMRCVVLGYGRCGSALCRRLAALGAKVTAAARRREQLARIYADGHTPCDINKLSPALDGCEVVFNTVPAPVLPEELLRRLPPEALVVELASAPGGCDAAVAEAMGLRYRNAPGLPGKAAPRTAGEYLGQVIRGLPHWEE